MRACVIDGLLGLTNHLKSLKNSSVIMVFNNNILADIHNQ